MATATLQEPMTTDALLAMPDNGTDRWLIHGELREKPMTVRNRYHSQTMAAATTFLKNWRNAQQEPRGDVLCGEAGVRLMRDPDTTYGIDIIYVSAEVLARQSDETTLIDGVPLLAIEILSPSDTIDEIDEKIDTLLEAGVALVWIIDTHDRTVTIYRPKARPILVAEGQELSGDPILAGFRVAVADFFR